ncbi:WXG100 family type VII secretion target [Rhodococcus sp. BS-15]|uniref:WXG100 family type VII secretion target n=1 Tax=Rhodococcus sp. BS-15 TaxID=1304954 RepID=UPI000ABA3759|nr:WXG100 family type VII secretion target [Rhodococcus sp. BS-15]
MSAPIKLTPDNVRQIASQIDTGLTDVSGRFKNIAAQFTDLGSSGFKGNAGAAAIAKGEEFNSKATKIVTNGQEKAQALRDFANQQESLDNEKNAAISAI